MLAPECLPRAAFSGFSPPLSPRAPLSPPLFLSKVAIKYERTGGRDKPQKETSQARHTAHFGARAALVSVTLNENRGVFCGPVSGVSGARCSAASRSRLSHSRAQRFLLSVPSPCHPLGVFGSFRFG